MSLGLFGPMRLAGRGNLVVCLYVFQYLTHSIEVLYINIDILTCIPSGGRTTACKATGCLRPTNISIIVCE